MRIYDLRQKEVINICDCQKIGYIADVEFDPECGEITHIIIPGPCKIWGIIGRDQEYIIDFRCVKQIGPDVVLVDVDLEEVMKKGKI